MTAARPQCDHCRLRAAGRCRRCDPPFPPGNRAKRRTVAVRPPGHHDHH